MKRVCKTLILAVLIFTIALPTNVMASYTDSIQSKEKVVDNTVSKLSEELTDRPDDNELVRVIVELNDAPVIEYATAKGVQVEDLSQSFVEDKTEELLGVQEEVITEIDSVVKELEVHEQFATVFNGFSTTVRYGDIDEIAAQAEVKSVSLSNVYERPVPQMVTSSQLTQSIVVNEDYGYTGEGMVVAIIDSGIDTTHKDFVLDDGVEVALTQDEVEKIIVSEELVGQYYTEKVPYGYNYMDGNTEVRDLGVEASMHGMHVAGTVAANGDTENGGIKGVAPNAQVLALKVFGNDPEFGSTFGDVIIAAIDDAIVLGADVMNLSLGSTAAFVDETDPEQMAVTNATENGILMSISAGNSSKFGYGHDDPYAENPDIGVVGSPGITSESLQVASVDNALYLYETTTSFTGLEADVLGYGKDEWDVNTTYELVAIGGTKLGGDASDYEGLDVKGKVVLVSRGDFSFYDKTEMAASQGAIGIVCYDHGLSTFYKDQGGWSVPFMKISKDEGLALEALLEGTDVVEFTVSYEEGGKYFDPNAGSLSTFSSWGTTPDLSFKPEISAPGGNIYSTFNNDTYGFMSGTSMAAPHVAGGSALMLERIKEDPIFADVDLESAEAVELAKNILMNTATPVMDSNDYGVSWAYASPRQQGAGSMNLQYAMDTNVVIIEKTSGLAKVNLGEVDNNILTFDLEFENYGDDDARYLPEASAQGMYATAGGYNLLISLPYYLMTEEDALEGEYDDYTTFYVDGQEVDKYIDVPGNSTVTVTVKIVVHPEGGDFNASLERFPNGFFLEGFATFYTDDAVLGSAKTDAEAEVARIETEITAKTADITASEEDITAAEAELATLVEELETLETAYTDLVAEADAMIPSVEAADAKLILIAEKEAEIIALQAVYDKEEFLFASLLGDLKDVVETGQLISSIVAAYDAQIAEVEAEIAAIDEEIEELEASLPSLNKRKKRLTKKVIQGLKAEKEIYEDSILELEEVKATFMSVTDDLAIYASAYEKAKARVEASAAAIVIAEEELVALQAEFTEDDQLLIVAYEAKFTEADAILTEIEAKTEEIQAKTSEINEMKDDKAVLVAELTALYVELDQAMAVLAAADDVYFNALPLSVPYISFYGDWSDARAFDVSTYEQANGEGYTFYGETYMIGVDKVEEGTIYFDYLGVTNGTTLDGSAVAISPNGDGVKENAAPRFSTLRNIKDVVFSVYDEEGNLVIDTGATESYRKCYYDRGYGNKSYIAYDAMWEGTGANGKVVDDGQYYYVIEGKLATGEVQSLEMPVYVDTVAPVVEAIEYKNGADTLTVVANDEGVGIDEYILIDITSEDLDVVASSYTPEFDLSEVTDVEIVLAVAVDYAGNIGFGSSIAVLNDAAIPEVRLSVEPFDVLDTRDFTVAGQVYDVLLSYLTVDDVTIVDYTVDGDPIIDDSYNTEDGTFTVEKSYDSDGRKAILVEASDLAGNDISFTRHFYIDATAPLIEAVNDDFYGEEEKVIFVDSDVDTYNLQAKFSDNFPYLTVSVNKDVYFVAENDFVAYENLLVPVGYELDANVALEPGYNTFVLEAEDVTGATTTETIYVHRAVEGEVDPGKVVKELTLLSPEAISVNVGESKLIEVEAELVNGSFVQQPEGALVATESGDVSIDGYNVKGEKAGTATVKVSIDGQEVEVAVIVTGTDTPANPPLPTDTSGTDNESDPEPSTDPEPSNDPAPSTSTGSSSSTGSNPAPAANGTTVEEEADSLEIADETVALASPAFKGSKYVNGLPDGSFNPDGNITRAEISAMVNRLVLLEAATDTAFNDVATDYWALNDIAAMENAKLIQGDQGNFKPLDNITKAEMVTIISRILNFAELDVELMDSPYTDIEGHWAKDDILRAYSYGIELSEGATVFNPEEELTRAEAVVMLNQLIGVEVADPDSSVFSDVDDDYWAYAHIMSAAK